MRYSLNGAALRLALALAILVTLLGAGAYALNQDITLNLLARRAAPSSQFWFGTDGLGRDLWLRCLQGMMTSVQIGATSALLSGLIALAVAATGQFGKVLEQLVQILTDTFIALPHLLLLILICFTFGGGKWGVILAVSLTHWPKLALILRAELMRIRTADYVLLARRTGSTYWQCCYRHFLPLLLPQLVVGMLLIFPHAVLHSAGLSFLGFGLEPHEASLGLLLSDALRYLASGDWWLAFYPGLTLVALVLTIDLLARSLQKVWLRRTSC
ncbi:peptide ABC transporter permease [Leminorella grimontii]|uniref:Peptide ABC transporter permease n=1 Tax=Leminorella grimontii TaxID=82981 RepID=A0AAV5N5E3_9GAMM|nr:ABC transporter permease [Leminorella grimontii]KFC92911.1 permease component of an ABC superfamily nickel transporter [Leminorella grimontii ATCC 33999 = DSM 5078]GKX56795.1 peptide ABC transporter permease [Leminorella grimontii]VFS62317.1 Nickel transport system permease protein nikC [Leminorella grimontii]